MDVKMVIRMLLAALVLQTCIALRPSNSRGEVYESVTNFPNPFDSREGSTTICYTLTAESEVKANIYDLLGNLVREYPQCVEPAGMKTVLWDGTDQQGLKVSKGGYILALEIKSGDANVKATRKIGVIH